MAKPRSTSESDDEFQDAVSDALLHTASPPADVVIEELTQQQSQLKLPDDDDDAQEDVGKQPENSAEAVTEELPDDFIDEEELREHEKTLSEEELLQNKEKADKMKLEGNELFKNDDAKRSVEIYTDALRICPTTYTKERAVLYGNRAAAKIKLDSKKSAILDCNKAVELWPEYLRVLLRRAKLFEHEDKLDEALEDYKRVVELDAGHQEAREALVRLPPIINERNERLKEEMMGKLKDLGNMILKPFGLSTSNFQMQQDPGTGSYSINFNQNAS